MPLNICQIAQTGCFLRLFTSQRGRQQKVSPVLPDEIVSDHLGGGPAAQETDVPDELGRQGQRRLQEISPFHCQVADLPSAKLPDQKQEELLVGERKKGEYLLSTEGPKCSNSMVHPQKRLCKCHSGFLVVVRRLNSAGGSRSSTGP